MRKFKGKRRHRNKANAQSQSGAAKMSDAQQPSVSGVNVQTDVDLDNVKDTENVKAVTPLVDPASLTQSVEISSTSKEDSIKDKENEKTHDDETSKTDEKMEDNNNDKENHDPKNGRVATEDVTLTHGIPGYNSDVIDIDAEAKEEVNDHIEDLFIVEDTDRTADFNVAGECVDGNVIADEDDTTMTQDSENGCENNERPMDVAAIVENSSDSIHNIGGGANSENEQISSKDDDNQYSDNPNEDNIPVETKQLENTDADSPENEQVDLNLTDVDHDQTSAIHPSDLSVNELQEYNEVPDESDVFVENDTGSSKVEDIQTTLNNDSKVDTDSENDKPSHVPSDKNDLEENGCPTETTTITNHAESINIASDKARCEDESGSQVTLDSASDGLLVTETRNTSMVMNGCVSEFSDSTVSASTEIKSGDESVTVKNSQEQDIVDEIPSSSGFAEVIDGADIIDTSVDIGNCVDNYPGIDGTDVDNSMDNSVDNSMDNSLDDSVDKSLDTSVDNCLNPLDTSDEDKVLDKNCVALQNSFETAVSNAMCEDPVQQRQEQPYSPRETIEQQQQQQIQHLQQQLREQQEAMTRHQARAHAQQVQASLLTASLRTKLRRKEQELKSVTSQHETCISAVISQLLYLEGQMQQEHNQVVGIIKEKEDVIRSQKAALLDLTSKNERLLVALKKSHGYDITENGLSRHSHPVVTENGKYSIQDHGNNVVLRGNKSSVGGSHKVRFSSMKERLRRHKSSLELYHTEPLEPLLEGTLRYFGSQENLVDRDTGYLDGRSRSANRKQRCRSLVERPSELQEADEFHNESPDSCFGEESLSSENISTSDSYSLATSPAISHNGKSTGSLSSTSSLGLNELAKSRSVPHGLPTVSENDVPGGRSWQSRDRPHSLPSTGLLAGPGTKPGLSAASKVNMSPNVSIPTTSTTSSSSSSSHPTMSSSSSSSSTSSVSDSNPFRSFKNVFKRRGSKKKRSVSLGQTTNQEYQDTLKQHFKKYDLS